MINSKKLEQLKSLLEEYREYKEQKLDEFKKDNVEDSLLLDITFEIININNMLESIETSIEEEISIEDKVKNIKDNIVDKDNE